MSPTTLTRARLLPLVLLACALGAPAPARAITPVDSTPVVTLGEMAGSPVVVEAGDFAIDPVFHTATETFTFVVPPGTVPSGPREAWFLLDLDYRIVFGADSAAGFAWVSADTNGLTAAQAEYVLTRERGDLAIDESTVTLQDGQEERELEGLSGEVDYVNYARLEGIVDGRNSFTVRVEHTDGVVIERVEFHRTSGVSQTETSPHPFQLRATVAANAVRVGEEFELIVLAENQGNVDLGNATVEVEPNPGFARVVGPAELELGSFTGRLQRTFRLEALGSGLGQIAVLGNSAHNEPATLVELIVLPATGSSVPRVLVIALVGAAPVLLVGALWLRRARRRRREASATPRR